MSPVDSVLEGDLVRFAVVPCNCRDPRVFVERPVQFSVDPEAFALLAAVQSVVNCAGPIAEAALIVDGQDYDVRAI